MKSLIAFDLDGTLAVSKSALNHEMSIALSKLLEKYKVAIISGGAFQQFEKQVISHLPQTPTLLSNLYIFPTMGGSLRVYKDGQWQIVYEEKIPDLERARIIQAIKDVVTEAGIHIEKTYGEQIEDRGEQITFSALGQEAPVELKQAWDPDRTKLLDIVKRLEQRIPDFEPKVGGMTSVDVTRKGVDKAYAIRKIEETLSLPKEAILFVGDALFPGGNDYSATETGVECIKVANPDETIKVIHQLLTV